MLLSYAKIVLYDEILSSALPDDPYMVQDLVDYFPTPLRKSYKRQIDEHRLRREIIATAVTNEIVNRVGLAFLHEVKEKTGMPAEDIARAYIVSREIFGIPELWKQIEGLDNKAPASVQAAMLIECGRLIERETVWFLREAKQPLSISGEIKAFGDGVKEISETLDKYLSDADREGVNKRIAGFTEQGVPEELRAASPASCSWRRPATSCASPAPSAYRSPR